MPTSSSRRGGRRRGHPGGFDPGMQSWTACGSLPLLLLMMLLLGVLAMALVINAFPRLALLALGAVPLLVTLLATNITPVVLVPTVPLCFHPSGLGALASVGFVSSIAL